MKSQSFFARWFGGTLIADQLAGVSRLVAWVFGTIVALVIGAVAFGAYKDAALESSSSITANVQSWDPLESTCRHASLSIL